MLSTNFICFLLGHSLLLLSAKAANESDRHRKCELNIKSIDRLSNDRIDQNFSKVNSSMERRNKNSAIRDLWLAENSDFTRNSETAQETAFLQTIATKSSAIIAPFDASRSEKTSATCKLHAKQFIESLKKFELWAFQMHDASAKTPSGILNGNLNQLGDFDQCVDVIGPENMFSGKYCLAYVQISVPDHLPRLKRLRKLLQSHDAFVNDFDDPGHRVPRFSIINWALCVPSSCSNIDVQNSLNEYLKTFSSGTGIQYELRVEERMCQIKKNEPMQRNTKLTIAFFIVVVAMAILSTLVEIFVDTPNELLVSFSLWKNSKSLINLNRDPSDVSTIHGIRFINATLLLISHKSMALFYNPHTNRTKMIEAIGDYISVVGRAAAIYTDAFLLLSGLLTTYSIIGRLQRNQSPRIAQEYVSRLLRIVPTLGALILFCTFVLPELGSGPQWNLVVNQHADICKENWWRNFLFIHNYFGFSKMCLTHTHHLGIDSQLFVMAPILILILWKWPQKGSIFLLALAGVSTIGRFYVTVAQQLSNYVYFGASIKQLFRTADLMYSIPMHRATIYIYGIFTGYAMRMYKDVKLTKLQIIYGWSISVLLLTIALFGPAKMGNINYKYNPYDAAIYAAFSPIAWCTIFVWIIFTTHIGYPTIVSDILSWRIFLITTRISYAVYLTQFPVFFFNVGTTRHSNYYNFITSTGNLYEILCILVTSAILTLLFDTPFQNIKKYLFRKRAQTVVDRIENTEKLAINESKIRMIDREGRF